MTALTPERLDSILRGLAGKRVAVLGDLMLDRYFWGTVRRISPEAPVPVVEVESEQVRFGGAANVANNIQALGGIPVLIGLVGKDHPGEIFLEMMQERGLSTEGIVRDPSRPTTIKTRVIAAGQHVVRIDNESKATPEAALERRIIDAFRDHIDDIGAVILEDYNKGVMSTTVIRDVLAAARARNCITTVDPKFDHFLEYRGVTVFKPNRREVEQTLGGRVRTTEEVERAGKALLAELDAENVLITRSEDGMSLFERNGAVTHLPTAAENVQDVSGAGDTVVSTLTLSLAAGAAIGDACTLANLAGGVVVGAVGIVPITPGELRTAALHSLNTQTPKH
jgi:rfaE bifunctional protein kinase chain/domain